MTCLLYTSDAADERSSVDLGGRRIIKKKKHGSLRRILSVEHIEQKKHTYINMKSQRKIKKYNERA